jgi:hypothetical protein
MGVLALCESVCFSNPFCGSSLTLDFKMALDDPAM